MLTAGHRNPAAHSVQDEGVKVTEFVRRLDDVLQLSTAPQVDSLESDLSSRRMSNQLRELWASSVLGCGVLGGGQPKASVH